MFITAQRQRGRVPSACQAPCSSVVLLHLGVKFAEFDSHCANIGTVILLIQFVKVQTLISSHRNNLVSVSPIINVIIFLDCGHCILRKT